MGINPFSSSFFRCSVSVIFCFMLVLGGCSDATITGESEVGEEETEQGSSTEVEQEESASVNLRPGQVCVPGSVKACIDEGGKKAEICNNSGTNWVESECVGEDPKGEEVSSQCVNAQCTACFPGDRRCRGEDEVVECRPCDAETDLPTDEEIAQATEAGLDYPEGYPVECQPLLEDENSYITYWAVYSVCQGGTTGQICNGNVCESLCSINVKYNSYIGCDYWGVDLDNAFVPGGGRGYYDAAGAQYAIAVANPPDSPVPTLVEVWYKEGGVEKKVPYDVDGNALETEPMQPGDLRIYRLPRRDVNGTVLAPQAYRVTASAPVIAYQFNPLANENVFSNDASLLLPAMLLGKEYYVMTREQTFDSLRSFITVVAVLPGETVVSVEVTAPTMVGSIYPGAPNEEEIPHMEPGETRIFKLQQYDVLNIETDRPGADLTGTLVLSDQRVAVFGGSEAANAPNSARCVNIDPITEEGFCEYDGETPCKDLMDCVYAGYNVCCADHLEQQIFPVATWGTTYVATKSVDRGQESDIWRILAAEDNTQIVLVPSQQGISVPILNQGEWFEFESRKHFEIHSVDGKPILVGQFLAAQDAPEPNVSGVAQAGDAGTGDPAFILAVPYEQYRTGAVILTPAEYEDNYINITVPTGASVTLDGEEIPPGYFELVGSGTYSVYRTRLKDWGAHSITASEPAGVIVYGYDQYVSYGYTGGLDLAKINEERSFGDVRSE
jgi:hypothetical protein